jgi:hypothetical protein
VDTVSLENSMTTHRIRLPLVLMAGPAAFLFTAGAGAQPPRPAAPIPQAKPAPAPAVRDGLTLFGATRAFLSSLTPALRARAVFPFEAEERLVWHYVPMARRGVALGEMDAAQRAAARDLLRAALSASGFQKVETIRSLETVLREVENGGPGSNRNPDSYYFTVFGAPSASGEWALRYEGHHLSFHWTIIGGRVVASSPQFLGANPARVGRRASAVCPVEGTAAISAEENLGRALVRSLTPAQRVKGIVDDSAPGDILTAAKRRAELPETGGIPYAELDPKQRGILLSLIREHAAVQTAPVAAGRLDAIRKAGLAGIRFAWRGGIEPGQGHYYRIQGTTFLIEYDNTQNRANHIHAVWRDFRGDFGEDALAEHYRRFPPRSAVGRNHGHDHDEHGNHR